VTSFLMGGKDHGRQDLDYDSENGSPAVIAAIVDLLVTFVGDQLELEQRAYGRRYSYRCSTGGRVLGSKLVNSGRSGIEGQSRTLTVVAPVEDLLNERYVRPGVAL
jgi:hypothetical protein